MRRPQWYRVSPRVAVGLPPPKLCQTDPTLIPLMIRSPFRPLLIVTGLMMSVGWPALAVSQSPEVDSPPAAQTDDAPGPPTIPDLGIDLDAALGMDEPDAPIAAGKSDLDAAVQMRLDATTGKDLTAAAAMAESAIKKGLDPSSEKIAKELVASIRFTEAQQLMPRLLRSRGRQVMVLRDRIMDSLDAAIDADPNLVEAFLIKAELSALTGQKAAALEAASAAIDLLGDDPERRSRALALRAANRDNDQDRMADLTAAIQADPGNVQARRARAGLRLDNGDIEGGVKDLRKVMADSGDDLKSGELIIQKLVDVGENESALSLLDEMIERSPTEMYYKLRATLHTRNGDNDKAKADLDKSLEMAPADVPALLARAEVALLNEDIAAAKADLRRAVESDRRTIGLPQYLALQANIAINEERYADAINNITRLADAFPDQTYWRRQLGLLYMQDDRISKAIEIWSSVIEDEPDDIEVLRLRADARLTTGEHIEAIADYENALRLMGNFEKIRGDETLAEDASGIYNNLSWVLATSPKDDLRNGKVSLDYGKKAAELTDYEEAHILSTLAAAHAELGDFEAAKKWSRKAVELAEAEENAQLDQLKEELESYQNGKPWREKIETEENKVPLLSPDDLIDT